MEIKEMTMAEVETRSAELAESLNSENADLEAIEAEVAELEQRKADILAYAEERSKQVAEVMATPTITTFEKEERTKMEVKEMRNSLEYIDAYAEYVKGNDKEMRALLSENADDGTVAVPDLVYDIVKTAWEKDGIMSLVRKAYMKGNLKVQFEIDATPATAHDEGDKAPDEEELTLGIVNLIPVSIKKWISISDEVYDLRGEEFLRYIYDELTYQIAKEASKQLISKITSASTTSTAGSPAVEEVNTEPTISTIAEAMALLSDGAANPVVVMNRATWGKFKGVQYNNNYAVDIFEGLNVVFNNSLPSYENAEEDECYAIVGDFGEGALANFPNGDDITLKFDDLSLAEYDLIKIIGREYIAIGVVAPYHFVKITKPEE